MPESDGQEILDHLRKEGANIGHIFSKIKVKGKEADPLYKMLTLQQPEIEWNFVKFLVDRKGRVYQRYGPKQEPSALVDDIELLLKEN
ncbi:glutathione peroxidase homolog BsaA [Drosophila kikkawai]|uniref:Glutathione peroxidase homolog BsaA n=1 Tax=Drosophila kikkawai TaxID=30033 RepID=A0ABM4GBK9_DROKI